MCEFTCVKYLVFFFNFIFWILGTILMVFGAWAIADDEFVNRLLQLGGSAEVYKMIDVFAIVFLVLGAIIMVIGFFGCCGAIRENQCCLGIFFTLLLICFLVTVAIGGIVLYFAMNAEATDNIKIDSIELNLGQILNATWEMMPDNEKKAFEDTNKCCGFKKDFDINTNMNMCAGIAHDLLEKAGFRGRPGCFDKLLHNVRTNIIIAGSIIIGIAFIELLGMIMACFVCCGIKRAYRAV